ncbi:MAG: dipeptidase [Gemmatimonadota bacterium]
MSAVRDYIDRNMGRFREELDTFLRIPSVSARGEHDADTRAAAEWLADRMRDAGLSVTVHETAGHPIVVGDYHAADGAPTVLIYGHYDVQPPEPLDLWTSPPFEPEVRDGRLYARGSVDDKGQLYLHVKAIEAHLRGGEGLPVNVILLAEGEEEVGSEHLMPFVSEHAERLGADYIVISDSTMYQPGMPSIGASLRGLAYFQLDVQGPASDLHSGSYGGAVVNPANALAAIIASMHDEAGRVAIDGFYDNVDTPQAYLDQIASLPFSDESFREEVGAPALGGEEGHSTLERVWVRPTLDVNGLLSGYTGEGSKTVLPGRAMAKVSCRLVPNQDPDRIRALVEAHVARVTPPGVAVEVSFLHGGRPWLATLEGPLVDAAAGALEEAFGPAPVFAGEGGSIPIVDEFERVLGARALLMGFGLPGENAHAPDEWISVENFEKGTHAAAALLAGLGSG